MRSFPQAHIPHTFLTTSPPPSLPPSYRPLKQKTLQPHIPGWQLSGSHPSPSCLRLYPTMLPAVHRLAGYATRDRHSFPQPPASPSGLSAHARGASRRETSGLKIRAGSAAHTTKPQNHAPLHGGHERLVTLPVTTHSLIIRLSFGSHSVSCRGAETSAGIMNNIHQTKHSPYPLPRDF